MTINLIEKTNVRLIFDANNCKLQPKYEMLKSAAIYIKLN